MEAKKTNNLVIDKPIDSQLDYEFTKYFIKSVEREFHNLGESGDVERYAENAESKIGAVGSLGEILGLGLGSAVSSSKAMIAAIDKVLQKRKKCLVISIINSQSSESFQTDFRRYFIQVALQVFYTFERQLRTIYLKVGSGRKKKEDQLQAIQILASFAGARCFDYMVEQGTKEDILKSLIKPNKLDRLSSWWKLCTVHKLFYWVLKDTSEIPQKQYISAYNLFHDTVPLFLHEIYIESNVPAIDTINSASDHVPYIRTDDRKKQNSRKFRYKLRRPLEFEIKVDVEVEEKNKLVPLDSAAVENIQWNLAYIQFFQKGNSLVSEIADRIYETLRNDETFCWNQKILREIEHSIMFINDLRKLAEDTNQKVTEVRDGMRENKELISTGFQETAAKIDEYTAKLEVLIPTAKRCSIFLKVRFNVKEPIETFTGREHYLKYLHDDIQKSRKEESLVTVLSQTSVITGLGGIGKTETVRMYIHRYGHNYDHVVWIDAEDYSTAETQFEKLANQELKIALTEDENKPQELENILKQIYQKLCSNNNLLLLIFDNAESLDNNEHHNNGIRRFFPKSLPPSCLKPAILITSRNRDWGQQKVLQLGLWSDEECIEFVLKQLSLEHTQENMFLASELGEFFGQFPLALQSAVAVICQQSKRMQLIGGSPYGIQDLINDYNSGKRDVLKKLPLDSSSKTTMMVLWTVSWLKIKDHEKGELAVKILANLAYMSPTAIPKALVCGLFESKNTMSDLAEALELLTDYSMVDSFQNHLTVHRMIQDVTIEHLRTQFGKGESGMERKVLISLTQRLKTYWTSLRKSSSLYDDIVANIIHVTNYVSNQLDVSEFLDFTEYVADEISKFRMNDSAKYYEMLISHSTKANGLTNRKTQTYRQQLAYISLLKGKFKEAYGSYLNLLDEQERMWGSKDLDTVSTKHNVALALYKQAKFTESMKLFSEVLEVREALLGSSHIQTLQTKHYMALIMNEQGKVDKAMELYGEVLAVRERELGRCHSDTLATKNSIANVMKKKGEYDKAIQLYEEVLETTKELRGPSHPAALKAKHNLAMAISFKGKNQEAMAMLLEVLEEEEKGLGPSHPTTLTTKSNIASLLKNEEMYDEALSVYAQVLEEKMNVLGPCHPSTLVTKNNMASVIECQGRLDAAVEMLSEVFEARKEVLGECHPRTLRTQNSIRRLHCKIEQTNEPKSETGVASNVAA